MMREVIRFVTHSWSEHMALQWITNIMVVIHACLGTAILAGGSVRFPYPTYQPLIDIVNGQIWIWGFWALASAGLMMMPARWPQITGLWAGMVWQIMWCAAFSVAVVRYETAGATAAVAYGGFALIDAALLTARIVDRGD
jgi:hypothetical protein